MKARISGTTYEVEVLPYFPEGMFAGFTDVTGRLQPGMVVYKPSDLEFIETSPKLKPEVDWDAFRREAAKDILVGFITIHKPFLSDWDKNYVSSSIRFADELIKQLKEEKQ